MVKVVWIFNYVLGVLKYSSMYKILYSKTRRKFIYLLIGIFILLVCCCIPTISNATLIGILSYLLAIVSSLLYSERINIKTIPKILTLIFSITCIEEIFLKVLSGTVIVQDTALNQAIIHIIVNLIITLILITLEIMNESKKLEGLKIIHILKNHMQIPMLFILVCMVASVSYYDTLKIKVIEDGGNLEQYSIIAYILIGLIGLISIYAENESASKQKYAEHEKELLVQQKDYYETLLNREKETRKFRHDITNHLLCVEELIKSEDYNRLKKYMGELLNKINEINTYKYETGNIVLDALTYTYVKKLPLSVYVSLNGTIGEVNNDMKLCTIYSNLIKNAVEELLMLDSAGKLEIFLKRGNQYYMIEVKNTISGKVNRDKKYNNQGFGLQNIRDVLNGDGEELNIEISDDTFKAKVIALIE